MSQPIGKLEFWCVDEVIECLDVTPETERALLLVAPDAYCGDGILTSQIWHLLTDAEQLDMILAEQQQADELGYPSEYQSQQSERSQMGIIY